MSATDTLQVWIGCLASYNAGRLIGRWVDATDVDTMNEARGVVAREAVAAAKEAGEYPVFFGEPEEFYIADYNGFPRAVVSQLGEYPSYEAVARIANLLEEHGEQFEAWIEFTEVELDDMSEDIETRFEEQSYGSADSEEDYAREFVSQAGWEGVPSRVDNPAYPYHSREEYIKVFEELESYIDWESIARALFDHGDLTFVNGYIFTSNA